MQSRVDWKTMLCELILQIKKHGLARSSDYLNNDRGQFHFKTLRFAPLLFPPLHWDNARKTSQ